MFLDTKSSPKTFLPGKQLKSISWSFRISSCSAFNFVFANVFRSEYFKKLGILNLLTNSFSFIFLSSIELIHLFTWIDLRAPQVFFSESFILLFSLLYTVFFFYIFLSITSLNFSKSIGTVLNSVNSKLSTFVFNFFKIVGTLPNF